MEIKAALEAAPIVISARAGSEGRLFGSITVGDIASAIRVVDVDKRKIVLASPIKTTGRHEITVRLHSDVLATVALDVRGSKK
jgi:large subunit ribosomal protein L9